VISASASLAKTPQAKDAEVACRGNLALCQLNLKMYEQAIEQCERILLHDSNNVKANFRMSQATFELSHGKNLGKL